MLPLAETETIALTRDERRDGHYGGILSFSGLFCPASEGNSEMKRAKLYELYKLGFVKALREIVPQTPADHIELQTITGVIMLRQFIINEEHKNLKGAINQAREVVKTLQTLFKKAGANEVQEFEVDSMVREIDKFEHLLEYDLGRQHAFTIEKTGIYDTDDLIEHAEGALAQSVFEIANPTIIQDFRSAGRCLAFDLFTACGFHCVRAVEGTARILYTLVTGKEAADDGRTLGGIAGDLDGIITKQKYPADSLAGLIVYNLRRINNIYRKPITHPEMILESAGDARRIFELAGSTISLLADAIILCKFNP